jgi:hypothetical protein
MIAGYCMYPVKFKVGAVTTLTNATLWKLNKNPAKDFCWWDLDGVVVVVVVVCAVVDGSLDLFARSTCFFI